MEKEHITVVINRDDFGYLRLLAGMMGFRREFAKPAPSKVRGVPEDRNRIYAKFVRNGSGGVAKLRRK